MAKYRKKPVVIEAEQWDGSVESGHAILYWIWAGHESRNTARFGTAGLQIRTLETAGDGWFTVDPQDFVIRGVKGEFYACKPDIFAATYEPA